MRVQHGTALLPEVVIKAGFALRAALVAGCRMK
jgi:hypothetical protein